MVWWIFFKCHDCNTEHEEYHHDEHDDTTHEGLTFRLTHKGHNGHSEYAELENTEEEPAVFDWSELQHTYEFDS